MNEAVNIVKIKEKIKLYKDNEEANNIEIVTFYENGFEVVTQKGLYNIGDFAVYISPDFCLSDISLFESFIRPNGDESKSMLGKVGGLPRRIRAKKFNFHRGDGNAVYSNGILLPDYEVVDYIATSNNYSVGMTMQNLSSLDLAKELEITKYEEPETNSGAGVKGGSSMAFPQGIIRTDEENFNNLIHHVEKILPCRLIGRQKIDGSSITLWYKDGKYGIASRNLGKPLTIKRVTSRRKKTLLETILFWKKPDLNIYSEVESDSDFVKYGKPYLDRLITYCKANNENIVLQGELCGQGMKGSGNKNNPTAKLETDIIFFNFCNYNSQTYKLPERSFNILTRHLDLSTPKIYFNKVFNTIEEIKQECELIFTDHLIEGIVIRDESHAFSTKYMNNEYDSKK